MPFFLTLILSIVFFPVTLLASWVVVHPQEEKIILFWGHLSRIVKRPGLSFIPIWGRKIIRVSVKQQTIDVPKTVVADGNGNPIVIAGVCTYTVTDSKEAALAVEDYVGFVKTQAMAVLKQVASNYPYESESGHSLKAEAEEVGKEMVELLQKKVRVAGVEVQSYELADLAYAPEIAQAMLVRQQAQALVDARKIVEGAVEIVDDAVGRLGERGYTLGEQAQSELVRSLLVVICGDSKVQPTYPVHSSHSEGSDEQGEAKLQLLGEISKHTRPK